MPQPIMLKKLKLNGSMKTYKTFYTPKRCPFHYRGLKWKSRKSRNTWKNGHNWPWSKEWSRTKSNRVLPRHCTGHWKHPPPTTQEKSLHMDITRWLIPKSDWLYSLELYTKSAKTRPGAGYGSDYELFIAKFRHKLKKVENITRPIRMAITKSQKS